MFVHINTERRYPSQKEIVDPIQIFGCLFLTSNRKMHADMNQHQDEKK